MSERVEQAPGAGEELVSDQILNVPNALSALRLVAVPVFLWAIVTEHDALALALLIASGLTDYLDGKIARRYGLVSRLGQLLDPVADRLYIASTLVGLGIRDIVPWWLVAVLFLREAEMLVVTLIARRHGLVALPVHFVGKAATFNLLYAFPFLLLGDGSSTAADIFRSVGWGFAWWGTYLYWVAGILYAVQLRQFIRAERSQTG